MRASDVVSVVITHQVLDDPVAHRDDAAVVAHLAIHAAGKRESWPALGQPLVEARRVVPRGQEREHRLPPSAEMRRYQAGAARVGVLRLAAFQRAEAPEVEKVLALLRIRANETSADETIDVGLGANDVEVLLGPVGHEDRRPDFSGAPRSFDSITGRRPI